MHKIKQLQLKGITLVAICGVSFTTSKLPGKNQVDQNVPIDLEIEIATKNECDIKPENNGPEVTLFKNVVYQ